MTEDQLSAVLEEAGVTEEALRDPRAWFDADVVDQICDLLVLRSGNPDFFAQVGRRFITGPYTATVRPLLRAFGSPEAMFRSFPATAPRWCKSGHYEVEIEGPGHAVVSFVSDLEGSEQVCVARKAQLEWMFPGIFGLPAATIEHPQCIHRGDGRCTYHIQWTPPPSTLRQQVLAGGGAVLVGALVGYGLGAGPLWTGLVALLSGALGWAVSWAFGLHRQVSSLSELTLEQDQEVRRGLETQERRYQQLLAAKEDVDRQVEQRTQQLAAALEEVRELDQVKTRFFANVNHELRTPLQLILAPLDDLVAGRAPPGGQMAAFQAMRRSASRLHHLIDEVLDLARVDAGAEQLKPTVVDPEALIRQRVEQFAVRAHHEGVVLHTDVQDDLGCVMLDTHWIDGSLSNLLSNAIRHCDRGDTITVRARKHADRLRLVVEDSGPGIPAADLPRLFDRFAQSEQKEGAHRGTGLGLAFVESAARLHGGTATVESELGVGTTFTLDLPFVASSAAAPTPVSSSNLPILESADLAVSDTPVTEVAGPPGAPLAVIAEDEPDLRLYIADVLSAHYHVVACANGRIALEEAQRRLPDLVVTDMSMPEMTGSELCQGLRESESTQDTPVLLLTAHQALEKKLAAYEAGANDYLTKPFHAQELLARTGSHVALREAQRTLAAQQQLVTVGRTAGELAHLIANPLNTLINGLPILRAQLPERLGSLADAMADCSLRIQLVTNNLRALAEHNRSAQVHVRLGQSVRTAVRLAKASQPDQVAFRFSLQDDPVVQVRQGELDQALQHLLDYASVAAGPHGTVEVAVLLRAPNEAEITIAHSGPAASEEERTKLLGGVSASDTSSASIAMALHLVQGQQGHLTMQRGEHDDRDTFVLTLPTSPASQAAVAGVS